MTESVVWCDGTFVDTADAHVSVFDRGLTVGDGVFETLRTYGGVPFAARRHLDRLERSAASLGLAPLDRAAILEALCAISERNGLGEARLRVTVTAGVGMPGSSRDTTVPVTLVAATALGTPAPSTSVVVAPWTRNERGALVGIKSLSYAANVRALAFAEAHGASEAIFANTVGDLCEGTGSNTFFVRGGVLVTPALASGCLAGVTRALVLELAHDLGTPVEERAASLDEFLGADEAFLTSTTREVQPIAHIDDRAIASVPGPVTEQLAAAFGRLTASDLDP